MGFYKITRKTANLISICAYILFGTDVHMMLMVVMMARVPQNAKEIIKEKN